MKKNSLIALIILFVFLSGCNTRKGMSDAFGNFEADEVLISSEQGGRILSSTAEEGTVVQAGALLAVVDTVPLVLQKSSILSQLTSVDARNSQLNAQMSVYQQQKENLRKDEDRLQRMFKDGAATQKQIDDIEGALAVTDRQISSVKAQVPVLLAEKEVMMTQLSQIDDKLLRCRIVAPIGGTILENYRKSGEIVKPGESVCKIADLSSLQLRVYFSGDQLSDIKIGQQVTVLIDESKSENRQLTGQIIWIASEAEFTPKIIQTKKERVNLVYAAKIKVVNDGSLKIGMPGEVKL